MRLIFKIHQFEAGKMAQEIFRFTVIRPIQKKEIQETKNFTVSHTSSSANLENNLHQVYEKPGPLWEEELYVLIGQITRFAHVEEIKGPINRTRAHKAIGGPELSDLEHQQIEDKAIRQTIDAISAVQAIYNGYNYKIIVDADFGFERASQEVNNVVYNFAKEIMDRYASGITEIVKEQRAGITKEVNEINSGEIDCDLSGNEEKYLWTDEIRDTQLMSLGKLLNLMYNVRLAIERVILRIETHVCTVNTYSHIVPAVKSLRSISNEIVQILPDVSEDLERVCRMLLAVVPENPVESK